MKIGVLSDTHGLLRPEVLPALHGVDHILHAGDVGLDGILDALRQLAPVTAIRGNIDRNGACAKLPPEEYCTLFGRNIYLLHDVHALSLDPVSAGLDAVICGHSHKPLIEFRKSVLFFNPGAAGPRRFALPITLGLLHVEQAGFRAEHVPLL